MSTKKTAVKTAKKVSAPKPTEVVKPKAKKVVSGLSETKFVSFTVRAVIPTQQYGNIQPEITVQAPTYEMARDFVMPHIEEMYKKYAQRPIDGNSPAFVGPVRETVKTVVAPVTVPKAEEVVPALSSSTQGVEVSSPESTPTEPSFSEAGQKAKKMIELAVTKEALDLVQEKVKNSFKIPEDEKPFLYTIILKKGKTI